MDEPITRNAILRALRAAFEPLDYVYAMWEGGAAAFDRVDAWSDIDLQIDVADERVADAFDVAERVLASIAPIELVYRVPEPSWHGHSQRFYRLQGASPFLMVDFVVMRHSNPLKFLEREIHGERRPHFDKRNVLAVPPLDREAHLRQIRARLETLRVLFPLFQSLTLKELHRGNHVEALTFYHGSTLRPLVEVLRIRYCPARYNFYTRYVYYDLPREVVAQLEPLFFVATPEELAARRESAERLFWDTLAEIDPENITIP